MIVTNIVIPVLSLVAIFLFALQKFSKQIHRVASERFKEVLRKLTMTPIRGLLAGAGFTALIQSSTATTVILVGLVNAGVISFANSLGVIFGANIGSTITTQLVALKLTSVAPYFILIGFLVTYFGQGYKRWGKPIFYFGLVFFTLSLISLYIDPVRSDPRVLDLFSRISSIYVGIAVGALFTAVVQSSAVTGGLVVLLISTGILTFDQALGIILGANLGTTLTALLASLTMNLQAKRVAIAHALFNFIGVAIFLPVIPLFAELVHAIGGSPEQQIATAHILFNVSCALIFLIFIRPFEALVLRIVK